MIKKFEPNPRYLWSVFTLELRKLMSYRVDFWTSTLLSVLCQIVVAFFLWKAVFLQIQGDSIHGFTFSSIVLYYLFMPLSNKLVRGPEMSFIASEIYDGSLNRYLIFPVSYFAYKLASHLAYSFVSLFQALLLTILYITVIGWPSEVPFHSSSLLFSLGAVVCSIFLYYTLSGAIEQIAFWADNVWSLLVMQRFVLNLLGGALIPLAFFPTWAQELLRYTPFPYMVAFPVRCLMGQVGLQEWALSILILCLWSAVATVLWFWLWRKGSYQYAGVGI